MSKNRRRGNRHVNVPHENRIRVRGKRLDQVDNTKLTLAYWLLAKRLVEDKTDRRELSEDDVRAVADNLDGAGGETS